MYSVRPYTQLTGPHTHTLPLEGQPVRISSMVLLVAYAFYYKNVFSIVIYHHMPRERRCLRHSGPQQSHLPAEFLSNRRHRHRGMAASNPLHRDASASRQPSTHSLHCFTACNAALPSHKTEGLVGPLRPLSGSRSCGRPPCAETIIPPICARLTRCHSDLDGRTRKGRARAAMSTLDSSGDHRMRRTAGIENNIGTRVERREKGSDRLPPYHRRSGRARPAALQARSHRTAEAVAHPFTRPQRGAVPSQPSHSRPLC